MRLPFFYGWLVVAVVFVTMGIGVNARTAFSLLFPPILDEFGWERGVTAGAFSFGFLVSAVLSPSLGRLMDRRRPARRHRAGRRPDGGRAAAGAARDASPGTSTPRSACWWAAAACAWATPGSRCSCPTGSCAGAAWPSASPSPASASARSSCCRGCRRVIERCRLAHGLLGDGRPGAGRAGAAQPAAAQVGREDIGLQPDGAAAPERDGGRAAAVQRRRRGLGRRRLDARPRHAHGALLVDRARLLLRPLRLVRGAGAPDQVPGRDRLQPRRSRPGRWGSSASPASPARSRSATSRTASAANGCGPRAASGFAVCYVALLAAAVRPEPDAALRHDRWRRACSATASPRCSAPSSPRSSRAGTTARIFGTLMLAAIGGGALGPWVTGALHDALRQLRRSPSGSASC